MNILISGSSSYVGKKVLENLNANYFCLINKNSKSDINLKNSDKFIISQIHKINKDIKFDYFFHFAGSSSKQYSLINNFYVSVFIPLKIIFNFQIDKVVFLDTYWQFLLNKQMNLYVIFKKINNLIFYIFSSKFNYKYMRIFLGDLYGDNDSREKIDKFLIKNQYANEIILNSSSETLIFPIHIKNFINFINNLEPNFNFFRYIKINFFGNGILLKEYVDIFLSTIQNQPRIIFKGKIKNKIMKSNSHFCLLPINYRKELTNHFNAEI
tara:strand:- start:4502 stop:5305 length:804 start_codon:yes stop_codon:yes gene_type:complete